MARAHPILRGIDSAPFFFLSSIRTDERFLQLGGRILASSSEQNSWLLSGDTIALQPRDPRQWSDTMGNERGPHVMLVALEGTLPSGYDVAPGGAGAPSRVRIEAPGTSVSDVRVLVAGGGSLLRDETLLPPRPHQGQLPHGLVLALNAIEWLAWEDGPLWGTVSATSL